MTFRSIGLCAVLFVSSLFTMLALVAVKRSKKLCYNIKVFSINLLISDLIIGALSIIFLLSGGSLFSREMDYLCMVILVISICMLWTYFVTSFTLTAMALDRLTSLITPYRYLSIVTSKRCLGSCIVFWMVSLLISFSVLPENFWKFSACSSGAFKNGTIHAGLSESNLVVIGVCNLVILSVNLVSYISIIVVVWHKRQTLTHGQKSVMKKLFTITLSYIVFHGPFCILTIVKGPGNVDGGKLETLVNAAGILVTLSIFVDPILYVWRYKTCRYQLMMMMTPFCDGKREQIRQRHNQIYCNYDINYVSRESIQNQGDQKITVDE